MKSVKNSWWGRFILILIHMNTWRQPVDTASVCSSWLYVQSTTYRGHRWLQILILYYVNICMIINALKKRDEGCEWRHYIHVTQREIRCVCVCVKWYQYLCQYVDIWRQSDVYINKRLSGGLKLLLVDKLLTFSRCGDICVNKTELQGINLLQ